MAEKMGNCILSREEDPSGWVGKYPSECRAPNGHFFEVKVNDGGLEDLYYHIGRINLVLDKDGRIASWYNG